MRKSMYNQAIFFLPKQQQQQKKKVKSSFFHDVKEKEVFDLHSKNHFVVQKMLNFLIIVLFTPELKS